MVQRGHDGGSPPSPASASTGRTCSVQQENAVQQCLMHAPPVFFSESERYFITAVLEGGLDVPLNGMLTIRGRSHAQQMAGKEIERRQGQCPSSRRMLSAVPSSDAQLPFPAPHLASACSWSSFFVIVFCGFSTNTLAALCTMAASARARAPVMPRRRAWGTRFRLKLDCGGEAGHPMLYFSRASTALLRWIVL